jgi:hypothetical protein
VQIGDNRAAEWVRRSNPVALGLLFSGLAGHLFMYYHERKDSVNPQLLALKKKKSPNLPSLGAPRSISKATLGMPKNHQTSHPWARPNQSVRQLWYYLHTSPGLSPSTSHSLGLPPPHCLNSWSSLPPLIKASRDTHTPPPIWCMVASVCGLWPQCGHLETTQASGSSMTLLQFLNHPGCGENCIRKFSCFSVRVGACCTGLPAGLPIKENPEEPCYQSAASDGHRHTPRGHNLNYTIWTPYAESVSSHQAPFSINQVSLDAP